MNRHRRCTGGYLKTYRIVHPRCLGAWELRSLWDNGFHVTREQLHHRGNTVRGVRLSNILCRHRGYQRLGWRDAYFHMAGAISTHPRRRVRSGLQKIDRCRIRMVGVIGSAAADSDDFGVADCRKKLVTGRVVGTVVGKLGEGVWRVRGDLLEQPSTFRFEYVVVSIEILELVVAAEQNAAWALRRRKLEQTHRRLCIDQIACPALSVDQSVEGLCAVEPVVQQSDALTNRVVLGFK